MIEQSRELGLHQAHLIASIEDLTRTLGSVRFSTEFDMRIIDHGETNVSASRAEAACLVPLLLDCFPERLWTPNSVLRRVLTRGSVLETFHAQVDRRLAGFAALHAMEDSMVRLHWLAVATEHRRQGIATRLLKACAKSAKHMGAQRVFLTTERDKTPALRLYSALGFCEVHDQCGLYQQSDTVRAVRCAGPDRVGGTDKPAQ